MVAWKRFPVPVFEHEVFKDMAYTAPAALSLQDADALAASLRGGGKSDVGGAHFVMPSEALFDRFQIKGEHRHAVMCLLPARSTHVLGRSWAWKIQRALVLDSLDAGAAKVLYDWKTPRPMNTRLGPEDGVELTQDICYVITGNKFADHWLGNRSIIENNWESGHGRKGFRILGGSEPNMDDFHHTCLVFDWQA